MLITDHINLTGQTPLHGPTFIDMSGAYETSQSQAIMKAGKHAGLKIHLGILAGITGPSYETSAEVRMLRCLGADAVCMSSILEVIAAKFYGMKVLGLSFISNRAAGIEKRSHSHHDVLRAAQKYRNAFSLFLQEVIKIFAQI